ncbi:hypothetical protein C8Q69DRAFT_478812 [Paecilomyces variotii]|uniref:Uncharacterized protein n=1 Tax=Byssochlamys spectabilis TaxID=264951 RepID=A0A443HKL8_BYSSP|nr:hypothetical protein C8Q69DRAFT_478812 [Paecilomyces variotii]KAJ9359848.1 hypothetical protein DTO280E4_4526 [Paecilomyces variotii]RWQ92326.1 hypothetical protein C8Q69DRAFT_478812 [Paecilomyces variotii]
MGDNNPLRAGQLPPFRIRTSAAPAPPPPSSSRVDFQRDPIVFYMQAATAAIASPPNPAPGALPPASRNTMQVPRNIQPPGNLRPPGIIAQPSGNAPQPPRFTQPAGNNAQPSGNAAQPPRSMQPAGNTQQSGTAAQPPRNVSRSRKKLNEREEAEIWLACLFYERRYLGLSTHNQFWMAVAARVSEKINRPYSPQSCKRHVDIKTRLRREEIEHAKKGDGRVWDSPMMDLIDKWIDVQDIYQRKKEEKEARLREAENEILRAEGRAPLLSSLASRKRNIDDSSRPSSPDRPAPQTRPQQIRPSQEMSQSQPTPASTGASSDEGISDSEFRSILLMMARQLATRLSHDEKVRQTMDRQKDELAGIRKGLEENRKILKDIMETQEKIFELIKKIEPKNLERRTTDVKVEPSSP